MLRTKVLQPIDRHDGRIAEVLLPSADRRGVHARDRGDHFLLATEDGLAQVTEGRSVVRAVRREEGRNLNLTPGRKGGGAPNAVGRDLKRLGPVPGNG